MFTSIHPHPHLQAGGRLDARYVRMNTGKGEVHERIEGFGLNADFPGPLGNKVGEKEGTGFGGKGLVSVEWMNRMDELIDRMVGWSIGWLMDRSIDKQTRSAAPRRSTPSAAAPSSSSPGPWAAPSCPATSSETRGPPMYVCTHTLFG